MRRMNIFQRFIFWLCQKVCRPSLHEMPWMEADLNVRDFFELQLARQEKEHTDDIVRLCEGSAKEYNRMQTELEERIATLQREHGLALQRLREVQEKEQSHGETVHVRKKWFPER